MCIGCNQVFGIAYTYNFKIMATVNTNYINAELLDQELNFEALAEYLDGDDYPGRHTNGWTEFWIEVFGFDKK